MNQSLGTLSLFSGEPQQASQTSSRLLKPQVWIAVCLTELVLQSRAHGSNEPSVVIEPRKGQPYICAANENARALGFLPGLKLSAALAMSSDFRIDTRSTAMERAYLHSLARDFQSLTPIVSIEPPNAILLEIRDSLKLFGGIRKIKAAVTDQIERRCLSFRLCVAPTAKGALWLSRHDQYAVDTLVELAKRIRSLPLGVTAWPESIQARLQDLGVASLGDCLRLPRDGFAKRIGTQYLRDLDRALGKEPDPRSVTTLPQKLTRRIEFSSETSDFGIILEAAESIFDRLQAVLCRRQAQVRAFSVHFHYLHREPDAEAFELIEPSHEGQRALDLFADRLARLSLPAPIIALELKTGVLQAMQSAHFDLFSNDDRLVEREGIGHALIERLRERLGPRSVHGVALAADHRPEAAWRECLDRPTVAVKHAQCFLPAAGIRPLWLLPLPSRLISQDGRPFHNGPLQIETGPERIESGWWDRGDIRRDYYTALSKQGEKLWIYRDRVEDEWYLHGMFG